MKMRFIKCALALAFFFGTAALAQTTAHAQDSCRTPRESVRTWLGNLESGQEDLNAAATCFDWDATGVGRGDRGEVALRLKKVLDARGLWTEVGDLPDTPTVEGTSRVFLLPDASESEPGSFHYGRSALLPEIWLTKKEGRWLVSSRSVRHAETLYRDAFAVDVSRWVEQLPHGLRKTLVFGIAAWQLIALFVMLLLGFLLRSLVAYVVRNWVARALKASLFARRTDLVDPAFIAKVALPIGTLAMGGLLWYFLPFLEFGARVTYLGNVVVRVLAAVSGVIVIYRLVDLAGSVFARKAEKTDTKLDDQLVPLLRRTAKVFVVLLGALFVLQNLNVDITSLLAVGTVGTLAISLAAKDITANLFGSVSIFTDRPFQVGDWVVIGDVEGVVEEVGMRSTRIRTFQNSLITMPNSLITTTPVDNFGARAMRRTRTVLGVTYDTPGEKMESFVAAIKQILIENEAVNDESFQVHFTGFGDSALEVLLYFFVEAPSWTEELEVRQAVYVRILSLADELGVEFAFPTRTLHMVQATSA